METTDKQRVHQHFHFSKKVPVRFIGLLSIGSLLLVTYATHLIIDQAAKPEQLGMKTMSTISDKTKDPAASTTPNAQSQSSPSGASNDNQTTITANGQSYVVPPNGSINKTVTTGNTTVSVSASNSSTASTTNSSSSVSIDSSSGSTDGSP